MTAAAWLGSIFSPKHLVFFALAAAGLALAWRRRAGLGPRVAVLAASFILLGGVAGLLIPGLSGPLGMHPSPMCCLNKLIAFAWLKGRLAIPLAVGLGVMLALTVLFRKSFCGWACPLGSFQELLHMFPAQPKLANLPFRVTNGVRAALFAVFVVGLLGFGTITYDSFNGFESLHWALDGRGLAVLAVIAVASLVYFRPYCYLVCPIGLVTWAAEPLALLGVQKDEKACDGCKDCLSQVPCPSLDGIVAGATGWTADCTSCGRCLEACPKEALRLGAKGWMRRTLRELARASFRC
ncbi:MAG: 4Fe-4S binding protein [Elusimicrobia bacterium]|nr:4Fe-4S binding protein [Elusimicrobiota bacterium]